MIRRIVLRFKGKTPDLVKLQIKALDGYWDDLFNGWSIPIEAAEMVMLLPGDKREYLLPRDHVTESNRDKYMHGMYLKVLQELTSKENALAKDIAIYDRFNAAHIYEDEPCKIGKNDLNYAVEMSLHHRYLQCKKLRSDLKNMK